MKKIALILLVFSSFSVQASESNGFCDFLLELGDSVQMDSTYQMTNIGFINMKLKHQEKIMARLNFETLLYTKVNVPYLQKGLSNICRYKKWKIEKVRIEKKAVGIFIELYYQLVPKNKKSKSQAICAKASRI